MGQGKGSTKGPLRRQLVVVSANSFWNIANFRAGLVDALVEGGYRVLIAAPEADPKWTGEHGADAVDIAVDRSGLNPLKDGMLFARFLRLFRSRKPDFFLGFTAKPNIYGAFASRLAGVNALPNVSGLGTAFMSDGPLSHLVSFLYRHAFRGSRIVFFQNSDDRDLFVDRDIVRAEQARVLPGSGIDLTRFMPDAPPADGALRFLLIGRLLGDKGVREFVEAAGLLKPNHPDWRFQLLGPIDEGNRTGISADEVQGWVSQGLIEYLGHADDVRPYIRDASAVVLPSYREGMPRSLLEGAAMARPLVATDVPGNRQLVEHGVNGLLCDVRSGSSLAGAMQRLGEMSADARAAMGTAGRSKVERQYSEELVIGAYLAALRQLRPSAGV
jgi:glycosyltransferase involved in cell wall biosynthesis